MPNTQIEAKGFFASLFDFGFTSFITFKFLRYFYAGGVVLILLTGIFFFFEGISQGGVYILGAIIAPIATLAYLIVLRISLEIVAMFFRIGDNTATMAAAAGSAGPTSEGPHSGLAGPYSGPTGPVSGPLPTPGR
jgi:Domain of unknown function (DUF4282)